MVLRRKEVTAAFHHLLTLHLRPTGNNILASTVDAQVQNRTTRNIHRII